MSQVAARTFRDVDDVIDARAVEPVFQPIVRLDLGEVVGYEALARGPQGTPWANPMELFEAATKCGRLAELDWVCRAAAYRVALQARLPAGLTLFVNTEPLALNAPCPPDLAPVVTAARAELRVVVEMTERAIAANPAALLAAAAASRAAGWAVALDDVGADPASLALMPFVHPDIIKLDRHLVQRPDGPEVARVVNAAIAHAERTGAAILAEGIETAEHLAVARSMGATLGQGWLFGRPGPLPESIPTPRRALPFLPVPADAPVPVSHGPVSHGPVSHGPNSHGPNPHGPNSHGPIAHGPMAHGPVSQVAVDGAIEAVTPFSIVADRRNVSEATKRMMLPMSRYLESKAADANEPPVLLACFQEGRYFTANTRRRFADFAKTAALVAALATDLPTEPAPGVRGAALADDDPLRGEWNVIVVGPHFAAALVSRDLDDTGPDRDRRFAYALTYDRGLVLEAARALLHWIVPA
jgi:EAL domain-containing protein (putative c-di-GMP-specific phosphodiesterase class I)